MYCLSLTHNDNVFNRINSFKGYSVNISVSLRQDIYSKKYLKQYNGRVFSIMCLNVVLWSKIIFENEKGIALCTPSGIS